MINQLSLFMFTLSVTIIFAVILHIVYNSKSEAKTGLHYYASFFTLLILTSYSGTVCALSLVSLIDSLQTIHFTELVKSLILLGS